MAKDVLATGKYLSLIKRDGYEMVERINCTGIVVILPRTDADEVVLIEQFRRPINGKVIEFPAGLVNDIPGMPHESLHDAAKRELFEETGFEAGRLRAVGELAISPGMSSETVTVFVADQLVRSGSGGGDDSEDIIVHVVPMREVDSWLEKMRKNGCHIDAKIYTGLYLLGPRSR